MARKKVVKKAKKTLRNQAKVAVMNSVEVMERNFKDAPRQIAAQCQKELTTTKQQEKKLLGELKKALSLTKAIKAKCTALATGKPTKTSKKQLAAAKQGLAKANAVIKEMTAKHEQLKKQISSLADKQNKYTAIDKELGKFDTQWTKAAKKAAKAIKAKKTAKMTSSAKKSTSVSVGKTNHSMHDVSAAPQEEHLEIEATESESVEVVS